MQHPKVSNVEVVVQIVGKTSAAYHVGSIYVGSIDIDSQQVVGLDVLC
jgi:hypothetical protein